MIFGHTPTLFFSSIRPLQIWTNGEAMTIGGHCTGHLTLSQYL